ncbi:Williams-Beuren syndrome chromosomal region 27 protein-like [Mizuhopecten yessoensis]|uniref:Williams-Beuren syndrome chromosomal region 27 protein n=1 Tax=Mizuhopecten yessoensis TaxID=6573 RepID=A0A210PP97_MIZYE|nr:Williams-Beuren syndrome chromosomal region 27 protein-like [Mizuhopecten yessoensis]XP_021378517.1 Williams-Beuren syndrome chromosomal region 27 protein-like [Mizuhopecten yessoensis]XP_021378518.1 Williams-Beuren syndrome chromosomal region 27 protein-like [Mizuhopecten yessoensis]XP_021378519.1 Williams-Beuren syndrome chromosomal region 27 protein-like [Mizuhopecten yessoensis]XP_021378521.1 Williams-Beuren syndrome chromosomal region 27 protein-like [Mizuhopecten yessoensis]OWF38266.1
METLNVDDHVAYHVNDKVFNGKMEKHEIKEYYTKWALQYEKDLAPGRYDGPMMAAETCAQCFNENDRENVRVLDVAAGTGAVGEQLVKRGFSDIHALDPSEGMLEVAKGKNVYTKLLNEYLTEDKLPVPEGYYNCVTSSGGMGDGHIPCEALYEIIRIVKSGGYVVIVMREEYLYNVPEYKDRLEPLMAKLEAEGKWTRIERRVVPNYAFKKDGLIFIYKVQ